MGSWTMKYMLYQTLTPLSDTLSQALTGCYRTSSLALHCCPQHLGSTLCLELCRPCKARLWSLTSLGTTVLVLHMHVPFSP